MARIKKWTNPNEFELAKKEYIKEWDLENFPWVFWFNIGIRPWFTDWWKIRGSNVWECQIWIFHISIGRPWLIDALISKIEDYGSLQSAIRTNDSFMNARGLHVLVYPGEDCDAKNPYNKRHLEQIYRACPKCNNDIIGNQELCAACAINEGVDKLKEGE